MAGDGATRTVVHLYLPRHLPCNHPMFLMFLQKHTKIQSSQTESAEQKYHILKEESRGRREVKEGRGVRDEVWCGEVR